MSHHIIEIDDLYYSYPDGNQVLKGISFRITHGEKVALVGANGAGKSTLLLQFNGCLLPEAGRVRIGEMPVTKTTLKHVRRTVGLIFQDPDDQLFMPRVYDDVAFGPYTSTAGMWVFSWAGPLCSCCSDFIISLNGGEPGSWGWLNEPSYY